MKQKRVLSSGMLVYIVAFVAMFLFSAFNAYAANPSPVPLGNASNFTVLSKGQITDVPSCNITGDVGASPITGASIHLICEEVHGLIYTTNAAYTADGGRGTNFTCVVNGTTGGTPNEFASYLGGAILDIGIAYTNASGRVNGTGSQDYLNEGAAGALEGLTLYPGIHKWTTAVTIGVTVPGNVTLDCQGDSNAVFIMQVGGTLDAGSAGSVANGNRVNLQNGCQASNVFWAVEGITTLGNYSTFNGNIISTGTSAIAMQTGARLYGRALSDGEITLQSNTITSAAVSSNDTSPPTVNLITPANNTWSTNATPTFTFNFTDASSTASCTLFVDGAPRGTNSSAVNNANTPIIANTSLSQSNHTWYVNCTDLSGNVGNASARNISVDSIAPSAITSTAVSPANNSYSNTTSFVINVSFTELNPNNCWFENNTANNISMTINTTTKVCNISFAAPANALYNYTVYVNDTYGNVNNTGVRFLTTDLIFPFNVSVNLPANYSNTSSSTIVLNATFTDVNPSNCWFTNGSAGNSVTMSINTTTKVCNYTLSGVSQGLHNYTVYVNDSASQQNNSGAYFVFVDSVAPSSLSLTGVSPANNSYINTTSFVINVSFTDLHPLNCWFSNGTANNISMTLDSNTSTCNITFGGVSDSLYNYTVFVNDTYGNTNNTGLLFVKIDMVVPVVFQGYPNASQNTILVTTNMSFNITDVYLNNASISYSNVKLTDAAGTNVTGATTFTYASSSLVKVTFDPYYPLAYNTTYYMNISGIADLAGNVQSGIFNFSFTTNASTTAVVGQTRGNESAISTNIPALIVQINASTNFTNSVDATYYVNISNTSGVTLVEFNFAFSNTSILVLDNVTMTKNPNATVGSWIIHGLDLNGATMGVYVDNLSSMLGICVKNTEDIFNINQISPTCTGTSETWVPCPGSTGSYTCTYDSTTNRFKVSGLTHAALIQMNDTVAPGVTITAPTGTVTSTSTTLTATTTENARCRYATSDVAYGSMDGSLTTTLGTTHSWTLSSLDTGTYYFYVKCNDTYGNINTTGAYVSFGVTISNSNSGSSSSGGGSAAPNVAAIMIWSAITGGSEINKAVSVTGNPITNFQFTLLNSVINARITADVLAVQPTGTPVLTGKVYKFMQIQNEQIANSNLDGNVKISFAVPKAWFTNGVSQNDIVLNRYVSLDGVWVELPTVQTSENTDTVYYTASSPGFSFFAIGQKAGAITAASNATAVSSTTVDTTPVAAVTPVVETSAPAASESTPQTTVASENNTAAATSLSTSKTSVPMWVWILIGVVVLIVIVLLILANMGGRGNNPSGFNPKSHHEQKKGNLSDLKR